MGLSVMIFLLVVVAGCGLLVAFFVIKRQRLVFRPFDQPEREPSAASLIQYARVEQSQLDPAPNRVGLAVSPFTAIRVSSARESGLPYASRSAYQGMAENSPRGESARNLQHVGA